MLTGSIESGVLVVGAGPTGLTLGINLRRAGVPCRIIDQLPERRPHSRALGLHARTLEILDAMGVREAIEQRGVRYRSIQVYGDRGNDKAGPNPLMSLELGQLVAPFPYILCCPQPRLEQVLENRFRELGGELWRDTGLLDFSQDGGGVRARVHRAGRDETLEAALMVGCDGAHSRVRQQLGLPFEGNEYREDFLLADAEWTAKLARDRFHGFLLAEGPLIALPLPEGWRLVVTVPRHSDEIENSEQRPDRADMTPFYERIRAALGEDVPLPGEPRWLSRFSIHRRLVSHYRRNRILLAGDACHVQSPVGAQGMNTGIGDAFNLAWKLALFCRGLGGGELLDSYHRERRPVAAEMLRGVDVLSRASLVHTRMLRGARDSLLRFAGHRPRVGRRLLRRAAQLDVGYRQSPIVDAGPGEDLGWRHQGPLPGDRVPDARLVSRRDGRRRRIQGLLREPMHHLLLQLDEEPDHRARVILHALLSRLPDEYLDYLRVTLIGTVSLTPEDIGIPADRVHIWEDRDGEFQRLFGDHSRLWLMRPDGHLAYRAPLTDADYLLAFLERLFRRG